MRAGTLKGHLNQFPDLRQVFKHCFSCEPETSQQEVGSYNLQKVLYWVGQVI